MSLPPGVEEALGRVASATPVGGGSLAEAFRLELADGGVAFVKTSADASPGSFEAEAAGLRWLGEAGALTVPEVLGVGEDWLALVWVEARGSLNWEHLGAGLAALHRVGSDGFGALPPGTPGEAPVLRLGPLEMESPLEDDWPGFYAEHRVMPMARLASERGALPGDGLRAVEDLCARIDRVAGAPEPPARLHGDLWSGNVMTGPGGAPVLIDPAAYGGHREVDLAMLTLFGSPGERFFAAYGEVTPLADGWRERESLWQLFPLLVHAALFGGGYGAQAVAAARRYL